MAVENSTAGQWPNPNQADKYDLLRTTVNDFAAAALAGASRAEILRIAVESTARLIAGAHVAAIEVPVGSCHATIVVAVNAPDSWTGADFEIEPASALAQAIREPARAVQAAAHDALAGITDGAAGDLHHCDLECVAVLLRGGTHVVLAAWLERSAAESRETGSVLLTAARLLGAADLATANAADNGRVQQAIARAKQEWECTVDALPQLVCVLNGDGQIVRANRAIESWSLGKVDEVQGRAIHQLLHPECDGAACALANSEPTASQSAGRALYTASLLLAMNNSRTRIRYPCRTVRRTKSRRHSAPRWAPRRERRQRAAQAQA